MKKAILLFTLLAVCVGMVLPAYAAGSAFTPSVSYNAELCAQLGINVPA